MKREEYASEVPLYYPGKSLSPQQREDMDEYRVPLRDVTVDQLVYSMGRQLEQNFQTFYTVAEDLFGEERTKELAYQIGLRYGGLGYAKVLKAHGLEGAGSPRMMALYQDLVHYIRGPKHISALFAEYDHERCVVKRRECLYFSEARPENGKYTGEFERGACDGYAAVDRNLDHTEVRACRWRGDAGCEMHWVFRRSAGGDE